MALRLIILVALCIVTVHGQTKYCCHPVTWESVNYISEGQVASGTKKAVYTEGTEMVSVDGTNHRIASLTTYNSGGFKVNVLILQLFDQGVMYTVQSGECKNTTLPPWTPRCVPDSATLAKKSYYGIGDNKVDVDIYALQSGPNTVYLTVANADCTPVYQAAYGTAEGVSGLAYKAYRNITLGIKDTSVFDVPSICSNATAYPQMLVPKHGLY
ncbi:ependymin-related protein 2-like [Mercenaria mercenaria]|uniref:ependymin-related protein 2-like n=1 Tax=Mercenaria mercenaria TaxID=6596 RepID=UPI00234FA9FA|nr:ependymin-related protein 2-like [Mercenaria mercenaria]